MPDAPASDAMVRLGESALLLRLAVEGSGIGIWDHDLLAGRLDWDAATRALFGVGPDASVTYDGSFLTALHPEDRDRVDAALRASIDPAGPGVFASEYRVVRAGGGTTWIAARGRLVVAGGRATRLVGTVQDVTARKEAELALEATRDRYRLVTLATNDAIWDWDLVADVVLWNEALRTTYGWDPEGIEPTGAWRLGRIHPDDRARVEADIRAVIGGTASEWSHEYRFARADGRYAEVLDRGYMVRSPDGGARRMIGAMLDVTERNRAAAEFRAIFEGANIGIVQLDPQTLRAERVNPKLCEIWGAPPEAIVGHSVVRWTPEEDAGERDALHRRLAAGEIMQETLVKRYRRADGRIIRARVNLVSQVLGDRIQTTAMIEDITRTALADERRRALIALSDALRDGPRAAEILRTAVAVLGRGLQADAAAYGTLDPEAERIAVVTGWPEAAGERLPGLSAIPETLARLRRGEAVAAADVAELPADAPAYAALGLRAVLAVPLMRRGRLAGVLFAQWRSPYTLDPAEVAFAREVGERAWGALGRLHAEDQQRLLNRELSHRLKNILAMVQAIASQTLRNASGLDAAKEALADRLIALGKAHDILLTGEGEGADIRSVITGALAIHDDRQPERFRLGGPDLRVGPRAALSLALMVHELATNAVKYGALSVPAGRVGLTWTVAVDGADPEVRMTWVEAGGPPVLPPTRKGFGSRLIERGLAGAIGGRVVLAYEPGGLVCRVAAPLSGFQAGD
ncbi:PAS domain-containing sensor histidine kinase [Methylobacterium sp. A54F]